LVSDDTLSWVATRLETRWFSAVQANTWETRSQSYVKPKVATKDTRGLQAAYIAVSCMLTRWSQ
jgi:hypothetical protein